MTLDERLVVANRLLAATPYKPVLYMTGQGLRLFVNRMGSGAANIDIPALVNYGNGFLRKGPRSCERPNTPWGSSQEGMICTLITWVNESPVWRFRIGYWGDMVREHGHWLPADAVERFVECL